MTEDKRSATRVDSLNLLYVGIYEDRQLIKHAMGRTLNVSESGILLEMHFSIDTRQSVALTIALEDELLNIEGEVVYSREGGSGKFEIGIKFLAVHDAARQLLNKYINAFKSQA